MALIRRGNYPPRDPDDMDPLDVAAAAISGNTGNGDHRGRKRRSHGYQQFAGTKKTAASAKSLTAAEYWIAAGENAGVENPANAIWLSHRLSAKVSRDPIMQAYLVRGDELGQVPRLLNKMADLYWREYFLESIRPNEAVFDYLEVAWDDVRDYAYDSLRAAYLKQHGTRIPAPEYQPRTEQGMQVALQEGRIRDWVESARNAPEAPEFKPLDSDRKAVLRSRRSREDGGDQ